MNLLTEKEQLRLTRLTYFVVQDLSVEPEFLLKCLTNGVIDRSTFERLQRMCHDTSLTRPDLVKFFWDYVIQNCRNLITLTRTFRDMNYGHIADYIDGTAVLPSAVDMEIDSSDINRHSTELIKREYVKTRSISEGKLKSLLRRGGVPNVPDTIVRRNLLEDQLRKLLQRMMANEGSVVYLIGNTGSGKTVLVTSTLANVSAPVVGENGFERVFWVKVGSLREDKSSSIDEGRLIKTLQTILAKVCESEADPNVANSILAKPQTFLKGSLSKFIRDHCPRCLLVLDDVHSPEAVDKLYLGCRTLITARSANVMNTQTQLSEELQKMPFGFDEKESLDYLKSVTKANFVRKTAIEIHNSCSGFPVSIAAVGSILCNRPDRWQYCLELVQKADVDDVKHREIIQAIFENDSLKPFDAYYRKLVVFDNRIELRLTPLRMLFGKEKEKTENIMDALVQNNMCSMVQEGSEDVYLIHSLLHRYIKEQKTTHEEKQEYHKQIVDNYLRKYGSFVGFPRDGYIHWYLGKHLFRAGRSELLRDVFTNLVFLKHQIEVCGPAHTLLEYWRYSEAIDGDTEEFRNIRVAFQEFLLRNVFLLCSPESYTDVIQRALLEKADSIVFQSAMQTVSSQKMYLDLSNRDHLHCNSPKFVSKPHQNRIVEIQYIPRANSFILSCGYNGSVLVSSLNSAQTVETLCPEFAVCCALHNPKGHGHGHGDSNVYEVAVVKGGSAPCAFLKHFEAKRLNNHLSCPSSQNSEDQGIVTPSPTQAVFKRHPLQSKSVEEMDVSPQSDEKNVFALLAGSGDYQDGGVLSCSCASDGTCIALSKRDGNIDIYHVAPGKASFRGSLTSTGAALHSCFNEDDRWLLSCHYPRTCSIWDVSAVARLTRLPENQRPLVSYEMVENESSNYVISAKFFPSAEDSQSVPLIATLCTDGVEIWTPTEDRKCQQIKKIETVHDGTASCFDISSCGRYLAIGLESLDVLLYDLGKSGDSCPTSSSISPTNDNMPAITHDLIATLSGHSSSVSCVRFDPYLPCLLSGSDDGMLMKWSLGGDEEPSNPKVLVADKLAYDVSFRGERTFLVGQKLTHHSPLVAVTSDGFEYGHTDFSMKVEQLKLSPDETWATILATSYPEDFKAEEFKVFMLTWTLVNELLKFQCSELNLPKESTATLIEKKPPDFTKRSSHVAIPFKTDVFIFVKDATTHSVVCAGGQGSVAHQEDVTVCKFIDDDRLLSGGNDGRLIVWDWKSGSPLFIKQDAHTVEISVLDVSNNAKFIVSSAYYEPKLWKLDELSQIKFEAVLEEGDATLENYFVRVLKFSPRCDLVAVARDIGTIAIHRVKASPLNTSIWHILTLVYKMHCPMYSVHFSPDQNWAGAMTNNAMMWFDIQKSKDDKGLELRKPAQIFHLSGGREISDEPIMIASEDFCQFSVVDNKGNPYFLKRIAPEQPMEQG